MRAERKRFDRKIGTGYTKGAEGGKRLESGQEGGVLVRMERMGAGGCDWLAKEMELTWGEREGRRDFYLDTRLGVDDLDSLDVET